MRSLIVLALAVPVLVLAGLGASDIVQAQHVIVRDDAGVTRVSIGTNTLGGFVVVTDITGAEIFSIKGGDVSIPSLERSVKKQIEAALASALTAQEARNAQRVDPTPREQSVPVEQPPVYAEQSLFNVELVNVRKVVLGLTIDSASWEIALKITNKTPSVIAHAIFRANVGYSTAAEAAFSVEDLQPGDTAWVVISMPLKSGGKEEVTRGLRLLLTDLR